MTSDWTRSKFWDSIFCDILLEARRHEQCHLSLVNIVVLGRLHSLCCVENALFLMCEI